MAFNTLEYLKDGKVEFVFRCTPYDYEHLIENVRKAPNRIDIINGFLPKLKVDLPSFCFNIIYDIPEFADVALPLKLPVNVVAYTLYHLFVDVPSVFVLFVSGKNAESVILNSVFAEPTSVPNAKLFPVGNVI